VNAFVTGATGFIGGRVTRLLRAEGHGVVALVRDPARARDLGALGVDLRSGDITDRASVLAAMRGTDRVFHIAAWYQVGARDRSQAWRINVEGTRHVLESMRELGIPKGVYTSTLAVFSDTHGRLVDETYRYPGDTFASEYDRTKWAAHYEVALPMMRDGLPLVIVLPGLTYGPGDTSMLRRTLIQYLRRKLPLAPRGTAYCWAHVDDVARAHLLAMEKGKPGESYIIAGPPHTLIEALEIAERITGVPAPRLHPPPGVMRALAALMGPLGALIPLPESYTAEGLRSISGITYLGSNAKARQELGFDPRPLEEGLRETLLHEMELLRSPAAHASR
jgi:nucleoside-diphosphate-sugar epimerase